MPLAVDEVKEGSAEAMARVARADTQVVETNQGCLVSDAEVPERYARRDLLGLGGMGEIRRVWDRSLQRHVAMKLLSWSLLGNERAHARFRAETEFTAGLEHPGIVSIYDTGVLANGRPWYTMRLLQGRTLEVEIAELHRNAIDSVAGMRHLLRAFHQVCDAMAYAHARGVIHRDLKPQNIMVNPFGEVLILDWGLARRATSATAGDERGILPVCTESPPTEGALTRAGDVLGTPAYMPPEQARGELERMGPASDVYALGAILYELLCGFPPFVGDEIARGHDSASWVPPPLRPRIAEPLRATAEPLVRLCERCLAFEPEARPAVESLVEEVGRFRDGERRSETAREAVANVAALEEATRELSERALRMRSQSRALLAELRSYAPAEEKAAAWKLEAEAEALERRAALDSVKWVQGLRAALAIDPNCVEAHTRLARHYAGELQRAEARRDVRAIASSEAFLQEHDRGEYGALLRGHGTVSLLTTPTSARVRALRYVERLKKLELEPFADLGQTPLHGVSLPAGSYLLVLEAAGFVPVRYPVHIRRGESWDGTAPGAAEPCPIELPRATEIDSEALCYVPAGWFASGGDERAVESLPARRVWVAGFVAQRRPVDNQSYLEFLNDLVARGASDLALRHAPRLPRGSGGVGGVSALAEPLAYAQNEHGEFSLAAPSAATPWELTGPVALVDWHSANAYASWYAARTGRAFRLLDELEWEKTARGVDGRVVAFGDHVEPTRACMLGSHAGTPRPMPSDAFPEDESPYGVRSMTGNVRSWCEGIWEWDGPRLDDARLVRAPAAADDPALRAVRGGSWSSMPDFCRAAARFALAPNDRLLAVGFRLAYSWPEKAQW